MTRHALASNRVFVTRIRRESIAASVGRVFERTWIRSLLAGVRTVAIKINLCDYRLAESGEARKVYQNRYTTEVSAACLDEKHVVLWGPERRWIQEIQ